MTPIVAVVGLGYVGLPLAVAFGEYFETIGFDINADRIESLKTGIDRTLEVSAEEIQKAKFLSLTADTSDIKRANTYVVTVPTPIDKYRRPDLGPLESASRLVGSVLSPGDTVIYESTVYPGATEEFCIPILSDISGLQVNSDYTVGYSPERINPGDQTNRLPEIMKVTSGSTPNAAKYVDDLYSRIIDAGTHPASSIKVAEAAKVIENTQRDVNIALVNELALIFNKLEIDTHEVLAAAGTKWNFLPFTPGLVGGHCIGVDPYYLTHKAEEIGYHPEVILAGRRINDSMGSYVADQTILAMARKGEPLADSRVLVCGLTFKENCPDVRNTKVVDIIDRLRDYGVAVDVHDPWADPSEAESVYGITLIGPDLPAANSGTPYAAAILAVAHDEYRDAGPGLRELVGDGGVIYDVKGILGDDADKSL